MPKPWSICLLLLIVAAEVVASMAVWSGTPTDWVGEPLHFWGFEILRMRYWFGFELPIAGLWVAGWICLRRRLAAPTLVLMGACALGAEVMTSLYFWKSLTVAQVGYLGWPSLQGYVVEHLISWVVVTLLGLAGWYLYAYVRRRRIQVPPPPQALHG